MSGLVILIVVLFGIWLAALTLVAALTIRQIALLTVRFSEVRVDGDTVPVGNGTFSVADDGPEVGSEIPDEVLSMVPQLRQSRTYVLLIAATCGSCRRMAAELSKRRFIAPVVALIPGPEGLASDVAKLLPPELQIVQGRTATTIAEHLRIRSTPYAFAIEAGMLIKKSYMYYPSDFVKFVEDGHVVEAGEAIQHPKEVSHVT